jgi:hypothetical protein
MSSAPLYVTPREARAWTRPRGRADIAPSRYARIEGDGYLTIDAPWVVPALLRTVPIKGRVLEPAAGRGHLSLELRRAGLEVASFDLRRYANPLVPNIRQGDIFELKTLEEFEWVITNLPYGNLEELTTHLTELGARDHCSVALLVRHEWIVPRARDRLVHDHPHFVGVVVLKNRPRWVEKAREQASPRHNFCWCLWGAAPRVADPWLKFAGREAKAPGESLDRGLSMGPGG